MNAVAAKQAFALKMQRKVQNSLSAKKKPNTSVKGVVKGITDEHKPEQYQLGKRAQISAEAVAAIAAGAAQIDKTKEPQVDISPIGREEKGVSVKPNQPPVTQPNKSSKTKKSIKGKNLKFRKLSDEEQALREQAEQARRLEAFEEAQQNQERQVKYDQDNAPKKKQKPVVPSTQEQQSSVEDLYDSSMMMKMKDSSGKEVEVSTTRGYYDWLNDHRSRLNVEPKDNVPPYTCLVKHSRVRGCYLTPDPIRKGKFQSHVGWLVTPESIAWARDESERKYKIQKATRLKTALAGAVKQSKGKVSTALLERMEESGAYTNGIPWREDPAPSAAANDSGPDWDQLNEMQSMALRIEELEAENKRLKRRVAEAKFNNPGREQLLSPRPSDRELVQYQHSWDNELRQPYLWDAPQQPVLKHLKYSVKQLRQHLCVMERCNRSVSNPAPTFSQKMEWDKEVMYNTWDRKVRDFIAEKPFVRVPAGLLMRDPASTQMLRDYLTSVEEKRPSEPRVIVSTTALPAEQPVVSKQPEHQGVDVVTESLYWDALASNEELHRVIGTQEESIEVLSMQLMKARNELKSIQNTKQDVVVPVTSREQMIEWRKAWKEELVTYQDEARYDNKYPGHRPYDGCCREEITEDDLNTVLSFMEAENPSDNVLFPREEQYFYWLETATLNRNDCIEYAHSRKHRANMLKVINGLHYSSELVGQDLPRNGEQYHDRMESVVTAEQETAAKQEVITNSSNLEKKILLDINAVHETPEQIKSWEAKTVEMLKGGAGKIQEMFHYDEAIGLLVPGLKADKGDSPNSIIVPPYLNLTA